MTVTSTGTPPFSSVPVEELPVKRRSRRLLGLLTVMWTLAAVRRASAAAVSTSGADFFSRPLVVGLLVVVAPPQALAATVTSAAIKIAAVRAIARQMSLIEIPPSRPMRSKNPHDNHRMHLPQAEAQGMPGGP